MKLKHLLIGMLACVAAVSCKEDQPVEAPTLKVSETSLSFAAEGGEKSFNLTANLDWTATPDADWLSVEPTSGKGSDKATAIKVTADENTTTEARTATVKVKAGSLSETISVTQAKKEATEPEQPEQPKAATIKDFVKEYVKIIDVWTNNVGVVNVVGGIGAKNDANDVQNAHYVPDDTKVVVGEVEYTLADAVELASRSYLLLRGYDGNDTKTYGRNLPIAKLDKAYTLDDALPATHSYTWGQYPYAERTNGGDFKMVTSEGEFELMKVDILDDYSHRHTNFPGQGGALSNFCAYTGGYLAGYDGCCCVKRIMMAYAHFFKYMLDNNLQDATGVSADQTFDAPLFGVPAEPEQPEQPEPSVPAIEAGPYWIMGTKDNVTKVMSPLAADKNYGYAPSEEAVEGKSYAKNVFTFAAVEGGFTIADASGRFYYQEKGTTYKTFNAGTDGTLAGCVWTVTKNDDGTYAIVNKESGKTIRYAEGTYTSFGVYTDAEANGSVLVNLVKADNPLEEKPTEPDQPAVDVPWTLGTNAYTETATINGTANVPVLKIGTSKAVGDAQIKIPAGTTIAKFSAVAWKDKSTKITFSAEGIGTIHEVTLKGNDGATGNAPYTITTDGSEVQTIDVYSLVANINNGTPAPLPIDLNVTVTTDATNLRSLLWGFEFGTDIPSTPEHPEQPEQPEQPETPEPVVLAEWLFSEEAMKEYADSFGGTAGVKDNTAGDGGKRLAANVSGTGYISYVQIDKTAIDPKNSVQRTVGKTGHPYATGGWVGDYWLFTFGDKAIAKSSKVSISYITRTSKTGMKYWRLEYLDGTEWKPAMTTTTVKVTDGTEIAYNIEMNADGSTNVEVNTVVEYANDTAEPCFRMLCLANEQASGKGPLEAINTGTCRIAGAEGTSPVIKLVSAPTK